jgi:hypothetical protein
MNDMKTQEQQVEDYKKYRGKCKEMCEQVAIERPDLHLVRGHYICPIWGKQQHWWLVSQDGRTIVDPTVKQFPTNGIGAEYDPFDGTIECDQCGKKVNEGDAHIMGHYACCSYGCAMRLVGL